MGLVPERWCFIGAGVHLSKRELPTFKIINLGSQAMGHYNNLSSPSTFH